MKRVISAIFATAASLTLLLGFKTHTPDVNAASLSSPTDAGSTPSDDTDTSPSTPSSSSSPSTTANSSATTAKSTTTTAKASSGTKTVTGSSVDTRYGPVQVKVTVNGTKITAINVIDYPQNNPRDISINSQAVPRLVSQAISAQSADISGVSGATYTSYGFMQSLQSALAKV